MKRRLLELSAAWHLQAKRCGGLSAGTRKRLLKAGSSRSDGDPAESRKCEAPEFDVEDDAFSRRPISPGTRLMREWNGQMYAVDVTPSGYELDGKAFRSLSAVAGSITGVRWSGPRFFGL